MEDLYINLIKLVELLPIAIIGLLVGGISYFADKEEDNKNGEDDNKCKKEKEKNLKDAVAHTFYSLVVCVIIYACLDATDLPYLAKVGVASAVSFFGIDNIMSIVERVIALRSARK